MINVSTGVGKRAFVPIDSVLSTYDSGRVNERFVGSSLDVEVWRENSTMHRFTTMADLFAPDLILPEQYQSPRDRTLQQRGEIQLLYAVLQDAIECFQKGVDAQGRRPLRLAQEAEEWLFANDTHWPFSFLNICLVLDLSPEYLRRKLIQWRRQQLAKREEQPRGSLTTPVHSRH